MWSLRRRGLPSARSQWGTLRFTIGGTGIVLASLAGLYLLFVVPNDERLALAQVSRKETDAAASARVWRQIAEFYPTGGARVGDDESTIYRSLQTTPYGQFVGLGTFPIQMDYRRAARFHGEWRQWIDVPANRPRPQAQAAQLAGNETRTTLEFAVGADTPCTISLVIDGMALDEVAITPMPVKMGAFYRHFHQYSAPELLFGHEPFHQVTIDVSELAGTTFSAHALASCSQFYLTPLTLWRSQPDEMKKNGDGAPRQMVFILVDTLRRDAVSAGASRIAGQEPVHFPAMADLVRDGVMFTDAVANGNMTAYSIMSMMHSLGPQDVGPPGTGYWVTPDERRAYYAKKLPSLPAWLARHGIPTTAIGNVSTFSQAQGQSVDIGFEQMLLHERHGYDTVDVTNSARKFLERNQRRDFFLYLHYHSPHSPFKAPLQDLFGACRSMASPLSVAKRMMWEYCGEVSYFDRHLASLRSALENLKMDPIIVLTADHAESMERIDFADFAKPHAEGNDGPLRGRIIDHGKTIRRDELAVPLVFSVRDEKTRAALAQRQNLPVSLLDIFPTVAEIMVGKVPDGLQGKSLLHLDSATAAARIIPLYGRAHVGFHLGNQFAYSRQIGDDGARFQLKDDDSIAADSNRDFWQPEASYDLRADPNQERNLAIHDAGLHRALEEVFVEANREHFFPLKLANTSTVTVDVTVDKVVHRIWPGSDLTLNGAWRTIPDIRCRDCLLLSSEVAVPITREMAGRKISERAFRFPTHLAFLKSSYFANSRPIVLVGLTDKTRRRVAMADISDARIRETLKEWGYIRGE